MTIRSHGVIVLQRSQLDAGSKERGHGFVVFSSAQLGKLAPLDLGQTELIVDGRFSPGASVHSCACAGIPALTRAKRGSQGGVPVAGLPGLGIEQAGQLHRAFIGRRPVNARLDGSGWPAHAAPALRVLGSALSAADTSP